MVEGGAPAESFWVRETLPSTSATCSLPLRVSIYRARSSCRRTGSLPHPGPPWVGWGLIAQVAAPPGARLRRAAAAVPVCAPSPPLLVLYFLLCFRRLSILWLHFCSHGSYRATCSAPSRLSPADFGPPRHPLPRIAPRELLRDPGGDYPLPLKSWLPSCSSICLCASWQAQLLPRRGPPRHPRSLRATTWAAAGHRQSVSLAAILVSGGS